MHIPDTEAALGAAGMVLFVVFESALWMLLKKLSKRSLSYPSAAFFWKAAAAVHDHTGN